VNANLLVSNNQLESRMRETRQSGSVGGESQPNATSLPQCSPLCIRSPALPSAGSRPHSPFRPQKNFPNSAPKTPSPLLTRAFRSPQILSSQGFGQVLDTGYFIFVTIDSSPLRALLRRLGQRSEAAALSAAYKTRTNPLGPHSARILLIRCNVHSHVYVFFTVIWKADHEQTDQHLDADFL
jgi:hypothetical protein